MQLEKEIEELEAILASKSRVKTIIVKELKEVAEKYGQPRRSMIIYNDDADFTEEEEEIPNYPVNLFLTKEGYFKKITPLSLRMGGEQKLKDGDEISQHIEATNACEMLFFTNKCQVYKTRACDFADTKASVLGEYIPARLAMDEGEAVVKMVVTSDYSGILIFAFENGKIAKVPLEAYATKTNRKKLSNAYSDKSPLSDMCFIDSDCELLLTSSAGRMLLLHTGVLSLKTTRNTQGVAAMKLKKGHRLMMLSVYEEGTFSKPSRYRTKTLPSAGMLPSAEEDSSQQFSLI